jgi:Flp pilus assembly protein CpaB
MFIRILVTCPVFAALSLVGGTTKPPFSPTMTSGNLHAKAEPPSSRLLQSRDAPVLPSGKRAIIVKVEPTCGSPPIPGSHIDVLVWRHNAVGTDVSEVLLEDVLVLAASVDGPVCSYTLAVRRTEVTKLANLHRSISLSVRALSENEEIRLPR